MLKPNHMVQMAILLSKKTEDTAQQRVLDVMTHPEKSYSVHHRPQWLIQYQNFSDVTDISEKWTVSTGTTDLILIVVSILAISFSYQNCDSNIICCR